MFKKINSLKKILQRFNKKTFTINKSEKEGDYEIPIKIEICKIFHRILDMRENYLVDNFREYYRQKFLQMVADGKEPSYNDPLFLTLLPDTIQ